MEKGPWIEFFPVGRFGQADNQNSMVRGLVCVYLLVFSGALHAEGGELIYAFRNYTRPDPIKMLLVGEIQSKIKAPRITEQQSPFSGYDTRLDQVTIKVRNPTGLKVGQKLYIIDKNPHHEKFRNGLIVGEITVQSVLKTSFYGWVVTGTGILLRVREGLFVARTQESENLVHAFDLKKKGDFYADSGAFDKAVATYQASLVADPGLPEAHAALGTLFYHESKKGSHEFPSRSLSEFEQAWKVRENFRYRYDEMAFYRNYMEALHSAYNVRRLEAARGDRAIQYLERMREASESARRILPEDPDVLLNQIRYHLARLELSRGGGKEDRKKYDESLKTAGTLLEKLDPMMRDPKTYLKKLEKYRVGERTVALLTAGEGEYHRVAVLYYGALLRDIRNSPVIEDADRREKCKQRIEYHATKFLLHNTQSDPEVQRFLSEAKSL